MGSARALPVAIEWRAAGRRCARSIRLPCSLSMHFLCFRLRFAGFSKEKGFGFITRQDGTDVFIHFSNVRGGGFRVLEEGQSVDFSVAAGKKGQEARDVVARS